MWRAGAPLLVLLPPSSSLASRPKPATLWSFQPSGRTAVMVAVATLGMSPRFTVTMLTEPSGSA